MAATWSGERSGATPLFVLRKNMLGTLVASEPRKDGDKLIGLAPMEAPGDEAP